MATKENRDLLQSKDTPRSGEAGRELQRAEIARLQQEIDRYRALYDAIEEGFCVFEMIYDEHGNVFDFRYLDANAAFISHSRMPAPVGKTLRDVMPASASVLIQQYAEVVHTGQPVRFTFPYPSTGQWFEVYAVRLGGPEDHLVTVVFNDITERKRTEEALQASGEQLRRAADLNAFRVRLADALRPLTDPLQVQSTAMRVLGEYLQVSRVLYDEVDDEAGIIQIHENYVREGVPKIVGRFSNKGFGRSNETLRAGQTIVYTDVNHEPGLSPEERAGLLAAGVVSTIGVPLIKGGQWVASMGVQHTQPRIWTIEEIALVEEVGERTWAAVERARAEAALRHSEQRFRTITEAAPAMVWICAPTGKNIFINDQWYEYTGQTKEEAAGDGWTNVTHPEDWERIAPYWARCQQTGETYEGENRYRRHDGEYRWFAFRAVPLRGSSGEIESWYGLSIDIHDRKQAEEALRESEARIQKALSIETVGVLFFRLDGHITDANDTFVRMSGYSRDELRQLNDWLILTPPEFMNVTSQTFQNLVETGETQPYEKQMFRKDGSLWWGVFAPTRLSGEGQDSECVEFIIDITERKRAEFALREHQQQLYLLNETLELRVQEKTAEVRQLASDLIKATQRERQRISHVLHDDLQQRIYAIQMQLSFLQDALQVGEDFAREETSQIKRQLDDILRITRDLSIDLSPPILREEGLSHAIQWLAARMKRQYGLSITLEAEGAFAIPNEDLHVLLFNCVRELLFNVVKHAETSQATVRLTWKEADLWIEVVDDGKGFSPPPTRPRMGESGQPPSLGLPTIRHQLGLFDGHLEIHSQPGAGTRIRLIVPVPPPGE